ncbi:HD domain-containing phosphohydrolase [Bacillus canaveralius]|uniref:HD domain-containing phosphohydrolase n=1 Tax=Bacillus canaveralius TaxID=1403243 RepID=UPI000F791C1E|nr:HD domain-containing phosphohydrolase [Bacillus canaveralius]RSK50667.1 HD domain-containing protein [Bacillus canaveralius]
MILKDIDKVISRDILEDDIYHDSTLVIKKDTLLNEKLIKKLKSLGVKKIAIKSEILTDSGQENKSVSNSFQIQFIKETFFTNLTHFANEHRYGKLLYELEDLMFVEDLFVSTLMDEKIESLLAALRNWDSYSYYHSFDVFVMGTLLARKMEVKNLEELAIGYLLHDIGKINVARDILQKETKLTIEEFQNVQNHAIEGYKILKNLGFDEAVAVLAKSHHERIDGSGYPEGKINDLLSLELKILMIVDVYSALTLKRPYREPFHAAQAIQFLISDVPKFEKECLIQFIELLKIYPAESIVNLSNNKHAKIVLIKEAFPTLPVVRLLDQLEPIELPSNYSITISNLVEWSEYDPEKNFDAYIKVLKNGDIKQAYEIFQVIIDGMRIEEIYSKIIYSSITRLYTQYKNGEIAMSELRIAEEATKNIMHKALEQFMPEIDHTRKSIVLTSFGNEEQSVPLQIVADVLTINRWKVYNLGLSIPKEELLAFIQKKKLKYLGFTPPAEEKLPEMLQTIQWLKEQHRQLIVVSAGLTVKLTSALKADIHAATLADMLDQLNTKEMARMNG